MKVYTKTGDKGTTSLIGGERVAKNDIRVEAYGTVDELTAFVGLLSDKVRAKDATKHCTDDLYTINSILMNLEAHLAAGEGNEYKLPEITAESISFLESSIDKMQSSVAAITKFTIPGGDEIISLCHVCRTICRRAERCTISVGERYPLDENVETYLNRLSDYFYLLGRYMATLLDIEEILWRP